MYQISPLSSTKGEGEFSRACKQLVLTISCTTKHPCTTEAFQAIRTTWRQAHFCSPRKGSYTTLWELTSIRDERGTKSFISHLESNQIPWDFTTGICTQPKTSYMDLAEHRVTRPAGNGAKESRASWTEGPTRAKHKAVYQPPAD